MKQYFIEKLTQWIISLSLGLALAFETAIPFFIPCLIATCFDVYSAYCLGKRVHRKYPEKGDGKFKSEYKFRIMYTMIVAFLAIILANYIDMYVLKDSDIAVRFVLGVFFVYQGISILENWSSENDDKKAKALQKVLVNKAERHFNVDLSDFRKEDNEDGKG